MSAPAPSLPRALLAVPLLAAARRQGLGPAWLAMLGVLGVDARHRRGGGAGEPLRDADASARRCCRALELRDGVPAHLRTLVAVPTLLTTPAAIEEQIERLEVHHLASPEGDLHFALLSDWLDAATRTCRWRRSTAATAVAGIARLNRRYGPAPGGDRFLLLHRKRLWNAERSSAGSAGNASAASCMSSTGCCAARPTPLSVAIGGQPPEVPAGVRYVITLDADTRLPRDTVRRLIGKMAHPLNRPRSTPPPAGSSTGYAVLQPRVTPSLPVGREGSLFQRVFSSMNGIDPYAAAVSDVYQDLFGEGSYAGKGIYDVDAFEAALAGRVPTRRCSATICSRASSPAPVSPPMSRSSRNFPPATTSPRGATTAGRAATGSCCRGSSVAARSPAAGAAHPGDRPLEDARQSAANSVDAGRPSWDCWWAGA